MKTLRWIFYIQMIIAVGCSLLAWIINFLSFPFAYFESQQIFIEKVLAQEGHFTAQNRAMTTLHYFLKTIYDGWLVNFYLLQLACITLFFGGIYGVKAIRSDPNIKQ